MNYLPVLLKDGYKVGHKFQYPKNTTLVYSNFTPRGTRETGIDGMILFWLQAFCMEYLVKQFQSNFFLRDKDEVIHQYARRITNYLGPINVDHIAALHDLKYLPLKIKAVPEGTLVPFRVPMLTVRNTIPEFFWLTNMLETLMSAELWLPCTSATTAFRYRRVFEEYARKTGASKDFVKWQGHDFSFRGMEGVEAAAKSGAAHLLSFTGTDTIPAIDALEEYYFANCEKELIGGSVPATEHSVMCMGAKEGERETILRLISEVYPSGIVSIVCDTWDFWKVLTEYLPSLKENIISRDGKVVVRPDSGDPIKIICGDPRGKTREEQQGAIRLLHNTFGGTRNGQGYIELDPHVGLIYGDSITLSRQREILERLQANGFASSNVVLGIGSYTYQYVTRDTYGNAMKATYGEVEGKGQAIFKDPKTDDGVKKSARGLLSVRPYTFDGPGRELANIYCKEDCTWDEEGEGLLETVFQDGCIRRTQTLSGIRAIIESQL